MECNTFIIRIGNGLATTGAVESGQRRGDARRIRILNCRVAAACAKVVQRLLFHERQNVVYPTARLSRAETTIWMSNPILIPTSCWKMQDGRLVIQGREGRLFDVVAAMNATSRFSCRLDCRQQQCDQNRDNRHNDQQLDQGKPAGPENNIPSARHQGLHSLHSLRPSRNPLF